MLSCAYAVAFLDRSLLAAAGAPIKHDLNLTDTQFGVLSGTAFAVLYCLCGIPLGWLADRVDRRRMIAVGLLFWSCMTACCGLAGSFTGFLLARIGLGLAEASLIPAGMSLLASQMPMATMGRATAIFLIGAAVGNAAAHFAGGFFLILLAGHATISLPLLGALEPWRLLFIVACLPGLLTAGLFLTIREPFRVTRPISPLRQLHHALTHLYRRRAAYGYLTAATACSVTLTQAQAAWLPLYYVRSFGLSPGASALSVGLMFILSAPTGQWAGGLLSDKLQKQGAIAAPSTVLALCAVSSIIPTVIFCNARSLYLSEAAYLLFNFIVSAATPSGLTGWQMLTPERDKGMVIAILVSVVTLIGVGLGPPMVGILTEFVFHDDRQLGLAMLTLFTVAAIAGATFAWTGRSKYQACLEGRA
jgi:MFS family permease